MWRRFSRTTMRSRRVSEASIAPVRGSAVTYSDTAGTGRPASSENAWITLSGCIGIFSPGM
ncbi:Uncharacterised protein [Bordetella pertussis]|nr:Uncharacterised protein [Bordetella pertussis]CFW38698.1 Uncharacterised protein [Bordetella pertussis]